MADRAPRLRRHAEAVLVEPQTHTGARNRRDPPRETPLATVRGDRALVRIDPWDTGFVDPAGDEGLLGQREGLRAGRYSIEELSSELGEVISGQTAGRTSDNDITIAKFVGIARKTFVAAEVTLARLTGLRPPAGQRDLAGGR